jgi:thymidylate synthase
MKYKLIEAFDIPSAWRQEVDAIRRYGDVFEVKSGSECTETLKLATTVIILHPESRPLVDDKCITTNMEKVQLYSLEYLWTDSCHHDSGEEYTYGSRLRVPVDQIQKAIEIIAIEPNNRQVTLTVRVPEDINSPHPPCLTMIDLEVLDAKLNFYGYFRSWDAYAGFPENIAGLQLFAEALVNEVNTLNPSLYLQTGQMILHSKNCHLYKRQYEWADKLRELGNDSRRMSNNGK